MAKVRKIKRARPDKLDAVIRKEAERLAEEMIRGMERSLAAAHRENEKMQKLLAMQVKDFDILLQEHMQLRQRLSKYMDARREKAQ